MKRMVLWAGTGWVVGFFLCYACFYLSAGPHDTDRKTWVAYSIMFALPVAAIGALFAGVSVIQKQLRETQRELKYWQSIQQLDIELDKPSTHFKPAPPSDRS
jgi:hypothetical protein